MFEKLKDFASGIRMRYAFGKPERAAGPLERDYGLMSTSIPVVDDICSRARITPDRLVRIMNDADAGEPQEQARLFEVMLDKEPRFAAHLSTRRLAVLGCKWSVKSEKEPSIADEIVKTLRDADARKAIGALVRSVAFGYSGVAVDWLAGGSGIRKFMPIASDRWIFDEAGNPALETDSGERRSLVSYHPAQILYCTADGMTGMPAKNGLLRTLLWLYLFKNVNFTLWNQFLERFGVPFILGKLPSGDFNDAKKRQELYRSILAVRSGGGGVGTTETDMQMINGVSGSNNDAFEAFQRYCDETATLVILGQLATSDKAGGLSNNGAQDKVRQDILEADCSMVLTEMQKLVNWLLKFRYGIGDGHDFVFSIDCEKPEDMNIRAERDAKVAAASGCVLERKYAEETYGIRLDDKPASGDVPGQEGQFSDNPVRVPKKATAMDRTISGICDRALMSIVDGEALEAWRGPVDDAVKKAFGDLDPSLPDDQLLAAFAERAPGFLESLPGVMDAMDDRVLVEALGHSMLAGYVNGLMPADFWKKRHLLKEEGVAK